MMKKIIMGILYLYLVFSFAGCGNGSSSSDSVGEDGGDAPSTTDEVKDKEHISLTNCTDVGNIENYVLLKNKDDIVPDEENSTVLRYYSEKGVKRVCVVEGDAHLEREILE